MAENEIPAAGEAPETVEIFEQQIGELDSGITANEESGSSSQAVQMEMDAADLLGGAEQPATEPDAQAAELKAVLEAVVYVMNEPMPAAQIAEALGRDKKEVEEAMKQLVEESAQPGRGLLIREVAGGFQMATKPEHHEAIRTFVKNLKQPLKLSQAALETLAVIAYKQPITLPEILEIRGVQGGGVLKTLIDRKLVTTAGRKQVIGRPMLYKTTKDFLTQFGLKDVNELPSLKEFEEIRRQSMADEEFSAAGPQQNELPATREGVDEVLRNEVAGGGEGVDEVLRNEVAGGGEGVEEVLRNEVAGGGEGVEEVLRNEVPAADETNEVEEKKELSENYEAVGTVGEAGEETANLSDGAPCGEEGNNG